MSIKRLLVSEPGINADTLKDSLKKACSWLVDTAQVKTEKLTFENNSNSLIHKTWKGAIRGEYSASKKEWDFFCPIWHTGQAIKALVEAYKVLGDIRLIDAAKFSAEFIEKERISNKSDENFGLILAYEDNGSSTNTSAILESLDGLIFLSETTGNEIYMGWVIAAADWVANKAYIQGKGLFRDEFNISKNSFDTPVWTELDFLKQPGRPLLDDGIFLKVYAYTGKEKFRHIFYETAERLLREEEPYGNWIRFVPCNLKKGSIHPRQSYWWARPMLMAYKDSADSRFLECAIRAGDWYIKAQRADGGLFRGTYRDFKTDSFGHSTSGIACAALLWKDLFVETGDEKWIEPLKKALDYCIRMQFTNVKDSNLNGAILEKVIFPDGTDRLPYHVRDLGTIFFIQIVSELLLLSGL